MHLKLFSIGNSFSDNALRYFPQIVENAGCKLTLGHACIGGCSLEKHLTLARLHEREPANPEGIPYVINGRNYSLKELLQQHEWEIITIQQVSWESPNADSYRPFAKELVDYIRQYRKKSKLAMHQTWAYRRDNLNAFKDGYTAEDMYRKLTIAYHTIAKELGIKIILPDGDAFQLLDETPGQTFAIDKDFDPAKAVKPLLPKQNPTIHTGWFWNSEGALCYDHGHANARGCYLAGCVWLEKLYGKDARKLTYKPAPLGEDDAKLLREVAHKLVAEGVKPKIYPL